MVLPAALGIVLTAGLGLGSIAVPPTAGADELNPSTTQTSEAVPAAPNEAEASHPQADRVIDKIVGGSERGDEKGLPGVSDAPGADAAADDASDAQRRDGDVADRRVEEKPEPAQPEARASAAPAVTQEAPTPAVTEEPAILGATTAPEPPAAQPSASPEAPAATPTPVEPSASPIVPVPTAAPSADPSLVPTPSATASAAPSAPATPTASPSGTAPTATASASPTASPSATAGSPEASPSAAPSASPSASATAPTSAAAAPTASPSETTSPAPITGRPQVELGGKDTSPSTTAMTFKSANWTDAKGNALNGTVEMTLTLYRIGAGDERKATIPVKMENGSFSTMVDAESLFGLTTTELAGSGKLYILRVSSPDGGEAKTSFFTFVAGTKPTPAPTTEPTTPAPTTKPSAEPTTPAPSTKPSAEPTSEPTTPAPSTKPSAEPTTPAPSTKPSAEPTSEPTTPSPSADPSPAPTTQPAPQPAPPAPAPSADPNPAPTTQPAPQPAPPAPDAPAPSPEVPAPEVPAPQAPAPEAPPADAGAPAAPGTSPQAPAAEPVAPPTIIATLPATPEEEPAPAQPEASPSASPSAKSTEPKPTDPPRSPVTDGSQLTADNAGSLSGGRQGDRVSLVLPKDKAKEGDWVAVFLYPSGESAGWVQVDHSNSVQVDISNIDAGSHKLAIASRDSELLGWVQLEIARTDTVNTDLMDKANSTPVKEAVLGGDDWMLISAAGILTAGAAAYMFLARPRARRPIQ